MKEKLIVVEQKGSDKIECLERIFFGYALFLKFRKSNFASRLLIVGGANKGLSEKEIISNLRYERKGIIIDRTAKNTKEKSDRIVHHLNMNTDTEIFLVTSLYHQLRAYLTLTKTLKNKGIIKKLKIINCPCDIHSKGIIKVFKHCIEELNRCIKYGSKGDLSLNPKDIVGMNLIICSASLTINQ
jgi:hypothetical protein